MLPSSESSRREQLGTPDCHSPNHRAWKAFQAEREQHHAAFVCQVEAIISKYNERTGQLHLLHEPALGKAKELAKLEEDRGMPLLRRLNQRSYEDEDRILTALSSYRESWTLQSQIMATECQHIVLDRIQRKVSLLSDNISRAHQNVITSLSTAVQDGDLARGVQIDPCVSFCFKHGLPSSLLSAALLNARRTWMTDIVGTKFSVRELMDQDGDVSISLDLDQLQEVEGYKQATLPYPSHRISSLRLPTFSSIVPQEDVDLPFKEPSVYDIFKDDEMRRQNFFYSFQSVGC
ncbi:hypothetical protein BKA62DRAFT_58861 [Auriculariales sp. MPI-PUGE-AT-0066]|nr:hypothetical protein BKA62DRAFT_58861 [Auriculariales sp. MPI-PUGE-AT-0066]